MTPRPKDRPDEDPNVRELGGFDVTNLSVEALKRAGITFGGMVSVAVGENRAWKRHSEFLADDRPEWDVTDRAYARRATVAHVVRHRERLALLEERVGKAKAEGGKPDDEAVAALDRLRAAPLRGLHLPRSFPCLGMLRVVAEEGRLVVVECDACGDEFGVKTEADPRESDDRGRRRPQPETGAFAVPGGEF